MGTIRVYTGLHSHDKTEVIVRDHLLPALKHQAEVQSLEHSALYLVSTGRKAQQVIRTTLKYLDAVPSGAVFTWNNLSSQIYTMGCRIPALPSRVKQVLIEDMLKSSERRWKYFRDAGRFAGTAAALSSLFSELKHDLIFSAADLKKLFSRLSRGAVNPRYEEITGLFEDYQRRLDKIGMFDDEDRLKMIGSLINEHGMRRFFPHLQLLIVDGFYDFTALQLKVLESIISTTDEVIMSIDIPCDGQVSAAKAGKTYRLPLNVLEWLKRQEASLQMTAPSHARCGNRALQGDALFDYHRSVGDSIEKDDFSRIWGLHSRVEEVEAIASEIKALMIDKSVQPDRIAVVFPAPEMYASIVDEVFRSSNIPYSVAPGQPALVQAVVSSVLGVLECGAHSFRREDVFRALSSPFLDTAQIGGESALATTAGDVDAVAVTAGIRGGRAPRGEQKWFEKIAFLKEKTLSERGRYAEDDEELHLNDDALNQELMKKMAWLNRVENLLKGFFDFLSPLQDWMFPCEFRDEVRKIIYRTGIEKQVLCSDEAIEIEDRRRNILSLEMFYSVLDEVTHALTVIHAGGEKRWRCEDLIDYLRAGLAGEMITTNARDEGKVQVMGILDVRGQEFDYIFLGGLVDGEFPRRRGNSLFLSRAEREKLNLRTIRADTSEDRLLFCSLFYNTRKCLYLTYPMRDGEKEQLPSVFVKEVERVCGDVRENLERRIIHPLNLQQAAAKSVTERIRTGEFDKLKEQFTFPAGMEYLSDSFRNLLHNLTVLKIREEGSGLSIYEGMLCSEDIRQHLRDRFNPDRYEFSATMIDNYVKCPFSFMFSRYLLNICDPEDIEEDISAMERGSVVHRILQRFYAERYDEASGRICSVAENASGAEERMRQIAAEETRTL
ncbi:MAG: PD-(D/E)XK nuclease family protein, partial [bacterium]